MVEKRMVLRCESLAYSALYKSIKIKYLEIIAPSQFE
jgi:hypothetical protein